MPFRALLFAALLATASSTQATDWSADPATSLLSFSGSAEGMAFTGQFKQFHPEINFDPTELSTARFNVEITLASADTDNSDRDETLMDKDFFFVKQFPTAHYSASEFRTLSNGHFAADGTLSLRGVEKPVTLEFTWVAEGQSATLDGTATINRLHFDVGAGDWADASTISHEITVHTTLKLTSQ